MLEEPLRESLLADLNEAHALPVQAEERRARVTAHEREAAARETTLEALTAELADAPDLSVRPSADASIAELAPSRPRRWTCA